MDSDNSMSDDPSLNDLIEEAKSLGVWNEAFCALLSDDTSRSLLESVLLQLITSKRKLINLRLKEELKRRSLAVLKDDKVALVDRTDSPPRVRNLPYKAAKIKRVDYDFSQGVTVPYDAPYQLGEKSIDSEKAVVFFVLDILRAISSSISVDIHLSLNRTIVDTPCDIVLLYGKNRTPFAAVETKKNGAEKYVQAIFDDDDTVVPELKGKVQGEHLTQLNRIMLFGYKKVFGLISDGNHSMITCTECFSQDEDLTRSIKTPSKKQRSQTMNEEGQDTSPASATRIHSKQQYAQEALDTLYCSHYSDVKADGWDPTLKLLTHFVRLALNTVDSRQIHCDIPLETKLPARVIKLSRDGQSDTLARSTVKFSAPLDLWECLLNRPRVVNVLLFKHLGIGTSGECCLATTESTTSFCAVKFFVETNVALESANFERDVWNTIYNELPAARVIRLPTIQDRNDKINDMACLLMPYLVPIDGVERGCALRNGSIRACLTFFARKGYLHNEVKWCHLGFFRITSRSSAPTTKVYLCDLGSVQKRDEESESEWATMTAKWIESSLSDLENTAETEL